MGTRKSLTLRQHALATAVCVRNEHLVSERVQSSANKRKLLPIGRKAGRGIHVAIELLRCSPEHRHLIQVTEIHRRLVGTHEHYVITIRSKADSDQTAPALAAVFARGFLWPAAAPTSFPARHRAKHKRYSDGQAKGPRSWHFRW